MRNERDATSKRQKKPPFGYQCSRCDKVMPSPEAGEAHLQKKHDGHGWLAWMDRRSAEALGA